MRPIVASAFAFALGSALHLPVVHADPLFGPKTDFATGALPTSVAIGDLNGDGKPDLVAAVHGDGPGSGAVAVLLGKGDGGFGTPTDYDVNGCGINCVAIGDLNGDGKFDVIATVSDYFCYPLGYGAVAVLLGNGDGTFGPWTYTLTGAATSVAIGDLNGDGKPDLVVPARGQFEGGGVGVLLGNGDGSFVWGAGFSTGGAAPYSVAIGDLNADGKPDLATATVSACQDVVGCPGAVSVALGNGDGSFGTPTNYAPVPYGGEPHQCVAIGDLNGDSKPDLAVGNGASISLMLGHGDGTFAAKTDYGTGSNYRSVAVRDVNADGVPDLVAANAGSNAVSVLLGNGDGSFGTKSDYLTGSGPISAAIGDLNGDGKPDLAVANSGSNTVSVLLNVGCLAVPMSLVLTPNTLNLRSMGHWVTGVLEPEPPASPADIDVASIRLNGKVSVDASAPTSVGDMDNDGRPDLTVKFDRGAVELTLTDGDAVPVTVSGAVGSGCFEATDVIRVIRAHVTAPSAGSVLPPGCQTDVRWDTPAGVQVQWVALLSSNDDGATWTLEASQLPNNGSYLWAVPKGATEQARIAVVLVESADASGAEVHGVLGMSERFVIGQPLAADEPRLELALRGAVPNPGRGLRVSFSLSDAEPTTLRVYDVSGRELVRREVGGLGAGWHSVTLGAPRTLAPGIYLVHLIHGDRRLVARAVVVQ